MLIGYLLTRLYLSRKSLGHYTQARAPCLPGNGPASAASRQEAAADPQVAAAGGDPGERLLVGGFHVGRATGRSSLPRVQHNKEIAHETLGMITPVEYRLKHAPETAIYGWY